MFLSTSRLTNWKSQTLSALLTFSYFILPQWLTQKWSGNSWTRNPLIWQRSRHNTCAYHPKWGPSSGKSQTMQKDMSPYNPNSDRARTLDWHEDTNQREWERQHRSGDWSDQWGKEVNKRGKHRCTNKNSNSMNQLSACRDCVSSRSRHQHDTSRSEGNNQWKLHAYIKDPAPGSMINQGTTNQWSKWISIKKGTKTNHEGETARKQHEAHEMAKVDERNAWYLPRSFGEAMSPIMIWQDKQMNRWDSSRKIVRRGETSTQISM